MEELVPTPQSYTDVLARLNRASVTKHFDAYTDVPWDDPEYQIDVRDPRWQQSAEDALGGTAWYQSQPAAERARIGLGLIAYQTKRGIEFENVLSRGLLLFALDRANRSPEFRYAYHELIEEAQHSLMFQEFVNRSGFDPQRLSGFYRHASNLTPRQARAFPELFFLYVLAGEVPIDQTQRALLRRGDALHPLQRRIMQIHVTEEARHVCFAHKYLATHLPRLSRLRRLHLQLMAPIVTSQTARLMLRPPLSYTRQLGIPDSVMREVWRSAAYREFFANAVRPLCETHRELGLLTARNAPLYALLGLDAAQFSQKALPSTTTSLVTK
jgi:hypothetical protein